MRLNHYLGGILLVSGTTIGAAMLAVPIGTGFMGFFPSLALFFACWLFFLITAIFFIDINDSIGGEPNLISMAGKTIGVFGQIVTWILYLLLLYSLVAAYIAGSAPLFSKALHIPLWLGCFALPVVFGFFIYLGTAGVDVINRIFMAFLIFTYIILIAFVPEHVSGNLLLHIDWKVGFVGVPIVVTSFGYHIILPTLATYLNHDRKHLIMTAVIGSLVTIVVYGIWQAMVLGVVPLTGPISLTKGWIEGQSAAAPLSMLLQNRWVALSAQFFAFFAIVTSFLGVSLSLADFLTDGLSLKKSWEGRLIAIFLTFVPPLIFVFTYQRGFYLALQHGGAFVILLLGFLPSWMAWKLYRSISMRLLLILMMLISIGVVIIDCMGQWGLFQHLMMPYVQAQNAL
ncbi:MAG: tyrosine transporter [Simkaniaceae bacterium]|nr:tyrosine transporter [Simkaniaceae bacterium]